MIGLSMIWITTFTNLTLSLKWLKIKIIKYLEEIAREAQFNHIDLEGVVMRKGLVREVMMIQMKLLAHVNIEELSLLRNNYHLGVSNLIAQKMETNL